MLWLITAGESWCAQVFCKELMQSASLDIWTPPDNFFGQDDLLSLSLSLSLPLSVCLSVCLSLSLSLSLSLTHSNSVTVSLSLSLSPSLAPGSLFKNWHLSACSQKHLSELLFQNSKAAPSSSRSKVEVVVVVGLPYVMSFMSTRWSTKHVKKRLGSIQEELQKSFPTADTLPEKKRLTTWSLKTLHKNAIQKKTFTMNYRAQSKRHPICRGKLLSAHQGGAGRRCYGAQSVFPESRAARFWELQTRTTPLRHL